MGSGEGQNDRESDDDPLYEDDPDGGIPVRSIFCGMTQGCGPGCLTAAVCLAACLFVALALISA